MEVVEDFESRPHKAVTFLVERDQEFQVCRERKNAASATRIQQWKVKEGREEEEGEEEGQEKKMENEVIGGIIASVPKEADTVGGASLGILYQQLLERIPARSLEVGLLSNGRRYWSWRCFGMV